MVDYVLWGNDFDYDDIVLRSPHEPWIPGLNCIEGGFDAWMDEPTGVNCYPVAEETAKSTNPCEEKLVHELQPHGSTLGADHAVILCQIDESLARLKQGVASIWRGFDELIQSDFGYVKPAFET